MIGIGKPSLLLIEGLVVELRDLSDNGPSYFENSLVYLDCCDIELGVI
jgi:hypothetical protein